MNKNEITNEQQWMLLVLLLKELAIQKFGNGYQSKIASKTDFTQAYISRIFDLKYKVSLKNFLIIAKAIEINFFFESKDSETDLNISFEKAMEQLGRRPLKMPKN